MRISFQSGVAPLPVVLVCVTVAERQQRGQDLSMGAGAPSL
jgi:hypothetical protein